MSKEKLNLNDNRMALITQDIKNVFQELYDHYRVILSRNEYLKKEIENIKSATYKDEQLTQMKEKYDKMKTEYQLGFPISEYENKKINAWIDKQNNKNSNTGGAIGGRFHYEFIPTSIGTIGEITDILTNDKFTFRELY